MWTFLIAFYFIFPVFSRLWHFEHVCFLLCCQSWFASNPRVTLVSQRQKVWILNSLRKKKRFSTMKWWSIEQLWELYLVLTKLMMHFLIFKHEIKKMHSSKNMLFFKLHCSRIHKLSKFLIRGIFWKVG